MLKLGNVDQETIKDSNKKMIINLLYNKRELTKQQIAAETGVSIPTVINNVNELIQEGVLEEGGVAPSSGGRKPVIVKFNPDARFSIGVQINLHDVRIILANLDSEIKDESILEDANIIDVENEKDVNLLLEKVCMEVENLIEKNNIDGARVVGIGISLPGTVNEEKMVLELAPNLSLKNIDFNYIHSRLKLPVYLENEANSAAVAELRLGVAKDMRNLVYLSITEGMGTGIVVQDYLYKGKNKRAGEFGHMTVVKDGKPCNCGRKGCWEKYASESALMEQFQKEISDGNCELKDFFKLLEEGNEKVKRIWDEYLEYLAIGIQNIILIMDPHYIVVGGSISNYENLLIESLKAKVFRENSFFSREDIKIFVSKFKSKSSIIGAALLPLQKVFFLNDKIL